MTYPRHMLIHEIIRRRAVTNPNPTYDEDGFINNDVFREYRIPCRFGKPKDELKDDVHTLSRYYAVVSVKDMEQIDGEFVVDANSIIMSESFPYNGTYTVLEVQPTMKGHELCHYVLILRKHE